MLRPNAAIWTLLALVIQIVQNNFIVLGQYTRPRGNPSGASIKSGDEPPPPDIDSEYPEGDLLHPLTDVFSYRRSYGHSHGYVPVKLHPCEQSSCYPATGNLLIGREHQLYASSTCGLYGQQRYCIVSHLEERKKCFRCDSRPTNKPNPLFNHNISNIVYRMYPGTRQKSWWQSENGKENVYIQLDLEAEFHFTHLIITFKTFRPAAMLIERSYDFKQTWHVYRYFAYNCAESFPHVREGYPENLTDVVCESRYSGLDPSTDGEVIYRVLPPTLHIDNPYSEQVQNLLKMTNLRINFTKVHTLGDDLLDKREDIQEKYYYAITDMVVRGSCSCYGHANRCLPLPGIDPKPDMVHGRCECTHNTKGRNCEKCEDFFNDLPWRPAIGKQTNACKKCNCNNHANTCHFDAALYEATGRISGGVCDGCQHNTMGPNCEQCKPFYFRDLLRDIQDPEMCRPCDCDPHGSLDNGICDSATNAENSLEAGSCHCKENVEGRRCDVCKNGFWNFTDSNPDGCQSCTCNTFGTIDNQGCNVYNGECTCKRYVTGRDCNQCLPEYWGLSEKRDGCQSCDCDPGGSFDNNCDVISGQCRCREQMVGRTCGTPKQEHYTASLDFLLYEAESARASSNCQVVIREPPRDGSEVTWTGIGFMKAFERSFIEFNIDNIQTGMDYEIIIRYEPTLPSNWEEVEVTLERPGPIDPNGPCRDARDDVRRIALPSNSRSITVYPPVCLEAGKQYKIRLTFRRSNFERDTPSASVLIDSVVLLPQIEKIPWFSGSVPADVRRQEFERNHCRSYSPYLIHTGQVPEVCKTYYSSIGAYIFNGAFSCHCDRTGSVSILCDEYGGHCKCKVNVVGRRCDQCAPGTYGFGPNGCKACDCNSIGALDNFCNATTGHCKCRANTYGRACDQCRTGFWNFPNCQRCDCNGHAEQCDSKTGVCKECNDNTEGRNCEQCVEEYYGDPRLNVDIPCRPCPCPGIPGSNHSYADRCSLDIHTKNVICECKEGYAGSRCDVCADNYFGNPEEPGGACQPCQCSDNVDLLKPGNCDPHTGQCKQCLYDTTGDHCEVCKPGFYRYGENRMCQECVCHPLGTNSSAGPCDSETGQCICLPNVTGLNCDSCNPYHWKIASGEGCEPCNCDLQGSLHPQCNLFDGQCECKPGSGGRQCNECMARFFGDPKVECRECKCDARGSRSLQCDMRTGACRCLPGIGGYNCDRCDRGYLGEAPECTPCGECFDNWDRILQETRNQTLDMITRAGDIKKVGATGAYTKEFDDMQFQIDEIKQLLSNTHEINLDAIDQELQDLRKKVNETEQEGVKDLDQSIANIKENMLLTDLKLKSLKQRIEDLKNKTKELEVNGTHLQEANVQGALTLIQEAKVKTEQAADKAERTEETINYAERQIKATENTINETATDFKEQRQNNDRKLNDLNDKLDNLKKALPDLNELICDGRGDPCDSICGGAGCDTCGDSISCENGAKQQAKTALTIANLTEAALREKEAMANDFIRNVSQINTNETKNIVQDTFNKAQAIVNKSNNTLNDALNLRKEIREFMALNNTKIEDIKNLTGQILGMKIDLDPDQVTEMAEKIKEAVHHLSNIDPIIEETKDDLRRVNQLREDAENAKSNATKILGGAEDINKALENTTTAQGNAQKAINKASDDIKIVNDRLKEIGTQTQSAQGKTNSTYNDIKKLEDQLGQLQRNLTDNRLYANDVLNESAHTLEKARNTYNDFNELQTQYKKAQRNLTTSSDKVLSSKGKANDLFKRASALVAKVTGTEDEISKLENGSQNDTLADLERKLLHLTKLMDEYNGQIEKRVQYYKQCN